MKLCLYVLAILTLCFSGFAIGKDIQKDKSTQPQVKDSAIASGQVSVAPPPNAQEQTLLHHLADSLAQTNKAHWLPIKAQPASIEQDQSATQLLLIESLPKGTTVRGNALVLTKPGLYPYQAIWYDNFQTSLTHFGWALMTVGLTNTPTTDYPSRMANQSIDLDTQLKVLVEQYEKNYTQWTNASVQRGQQLTSFSKEQATAEQEILIAHGLGGYIAGLLASEPDSNLSGLVLIDYQAPKSEAGNKLNDKLSEQGPILEVIFASSSSLIAQNARDRQRQAVLAGNMDYQVIQAAAGIVLDQNSAVWLARRIHGWALSNKNNAPN